MRHLGMELHGVEQAVRGGHGRHGAGRGAGEDVEAGRRRGHQIAMAHPDLLAARDAAEENIVRRGEIELGETVLAAIALLDLSAEEMRHQLLAVADAEDRDAGGQQARDRWWGCRDRRRWKDRRR